jgi:hypothetical protein
VCEEQQQTMLWLGRQCCWHAYARTRSRRRCTPARGVVCSPTHPHTEDTSIANRLCRRLLDWPLTTDTSKFDVSAVDVLPEQLQLCACAHGLRSAPARLYMCDPAVLHRWPARGPTPAHHHATTPPPPHAPHQQGIRPGAFEPAFVRGSGLRLPVLVKGDGVNVSPQMGLLSSDVTQLCVDALPEFVPGDRKVRACVCVCVCVCVRVCTWLQGRARARVCLRMCGCVRVWRRPAAQA